MSEKKQSRFSGVLLPVSSLPSPYGIGNFGKEARNWIDLLAENGQHYWQVLPLGPVSYGDSPYQGFSAFAGNPYYIDLDALSEEGLVPIEYVNCFTWGREEEKVSYDLLYESRFQVLRAAWAASSYAETVEYRTFEQENAYWLEDYALFMSCKNHFGGRNWMEWDEDIRMRQPEALEHYRELLMRDISFWKFLQFTFPPVEAGACLCRRERRRDHRRYPDLCGDGQCGCVDTSGIV